MLAGTHVTVSPCLPPPGLRSPILFELWEVLLVACRTLASAHRKPNSKLWTDDLDTSKFFLSSFVCPWGPEAL